MFLLLYGTTRARRHTIQYVILILLSMAMQLFLCMFYTGRQGAKKQLQDAYDEMEIECVVCNLTGTQTDDLHIKDYAVSLFYREQYARHGELIDNPFLEHVKNVRGRCQLRYMLAEEGQAEKEQYISQTQALIGLTDVGMETSFKTENGGSITYREGFNEEMFGEEQPLCIVSEEFYRAKQEQVKESVLYLAVSDTFGNRIAEQKFTVAGTYAGSGEEIYCPWNVVQELSEQLTGGMQAEALRFTVKDNRKLGELKELLTWYFAPVDVTGGLREFEDGGVLAYYEYSVLIYDDIFLKTITQFTNSVRVYNSIMPILFVILFSMGFLISFLFIRNRKQEFAILRSLGTKKTEILLELLAEQFILSLLGIGAGLLSFALFIGGGNVFFELAGIYLVVYLIGAFMAASLFIKNDVLTALAKKE